MVHVLCNANSEIPAIAYKLYTIIYTHGWSVLECIPNWEQSTEHNDQRFGCLFVYAILTAHTKGCVLWLWQVKNCLCCFTLLWIILFLCRCVIDIGLLVGTKADSIDCVYMVRGVCNEHFIPLAVKQRQPCWSHNRMIIITIIIIVISRNKSRPCSLRVRTTESFFIFMRLLPFGTMAANMHSYIVIIWTVGMETIHRDFDMCCLLRREIVLLCCADFDSFFFPNSPVTSYLAYTHIHMYRHIRVRTSPAKGMIWREREQYTCFHASCLFPFTHSFRLFDRFFCC